MSNQESNSDGTSGSSQTKKRKRKLVEDNVSLQSFEFGNKDKDTKDDEASGNSGMYISISAPSPSSSSDEMELPKRRHSTSELEGLDVFGNDVLNYDIYQKALSDGVENDKTIRVNVVGNFAQGKTSLSNILVGKQSEDVQSTNGVEIIHCKYSHDYDGVKFCSLSTSPGDKEYHRRIASLVRIEKYEKKSNQRTANSKFINLNKESTKMQRDVRRTGVKKDTAKSCPQSRDFLKVSMLVDMNQCDPFNEDGDLQFWDFGGQFIFYATHTLFHSKTCVYLLVFDLTKPLSAIIEDTEFPNDSVGKNIQQYAEYWMRSIHSYVGSDDGFQPPVILVGTHKDLLEGDDNMRQKLADDYFDKIRELFENTPIINHIQAKDFAVDCTNPSDSSIVELRKEIIRLGSNLEEKKIPARWLPLEKELLAMKHKKIILFREVEVIDAQNDFPLTDREHIKVFLLFQHAKGNLFYFDEEPLSAYIALDTQYVIDAFRCIITSERFCKREPTYRHLWKTLRQEAKLNMQLLERVWGIDAKNNFLEHKDVLLMLMQRNHIISEALSYDDETEETKGLGWYVVPCFLRSYRANDTLKEFVTGRPQTMLKFVLSFNISPVVQIVFYRVIAALVGKWEIVSIKMPKQEKQVLLYENLGVFKLDRQHAGIIELHQGFLELRVQNLCNLCINTAIVDLFRRFVVSNVMNEFKKHRQASVNQRNPFDICFKCNDESHCFDGSQETVSLEELKETKVEPCPDMISGHKISTRRALSEWYQNYQNIRLNTDYVLEEKYLSKLSKTIGENWQVLGHELGLPDVQLEQIESDNKSTVRRIFKMLQKWSAQEEDYATFNTLIQAMKAAIEESVDWDEVRNIVEEIESKSQHRLVQHTSTVYGN